MLAFLLPSSEGRGEADRSIAEKKCAGDQERHAKSGFAGFG